MEPKKNPKADVHQKRGIIFNLSLVLSLLVVIAAFKVTMPLKQITLRPEPPPDPDFIYNVAITTQENTPEVKPRTIQTPSPVVPVYVAVANSAAETIAESIPSSDAEPVTVEIEEAPVEVAEIVHDYVERQPEPEGGLQSFYATLRKNLKYPVKARRVGTEGKVFVQFIIDKTGKLTDFKVLKGIGDGCDEEAIRVLSLTKWKAGRQNGVPVKVRMVQPVYFSLTR